MDLDHAIAFIGAFGLFMGGANVIILAWWKRKQDKAITDKIRNEKDLTAVQISEHVLRTVNQEWNDDKTEWAVERGQLRQAATDLKDRVFRLEENDRLNLVAGINHQMWDEHIFAMVKQIDPNFPPPPPIRHEGVVQKIHHHDGVLEIEIESNNE